MAAYLMRAGVIVRRDRPGGRKYVSLNKTLMTYRPLMRLLLALDVKWPATRVNHPAYRWGMRNDDGVMTAERLDLVFCSPVRSRILLYVAAVGTTDMKTMYGVLGIGAVSAMFAANHWEREGIIVTTRVGKHRLLELNPCYVAATQLRSLLSLLVARSEEYRALRNVGRTRMRPLLHSLQRAERSVSIK